MPLKGEYEWSEKNDSLVVTAALKGVAPSKVDILATKSTLKINFSPYLIDLVLLGQIDPTQHKAKVKDGKLVVTLKKLNSGRWGSLVKTGLDAEDIKALKAESFKDHEAEQASLAEKRKDRKIDDERFALRKQMALDSDERTKLDELKAEEKKQAEEEVYKTFEQLEQQQRGKDSQKQLPKGASIAATSGTSAATSAASASDTTAMSKKNPNEIFDADDYEDGAKSEDDGDISDSELMEELLNEKLSLQQQRQEEQEPEEEHYDDYEPVEDDEVPHYVPPPRNVGAAAVATGNEGGGVSGGGGNVVQIEFTPRIFPTPMRESTLAQEEDWIAKNRKHLKKHGVFGPNHSKNLTRAGRGSGGSKSGNISEEDPVWLKAKGDEYCRHNDYMSAINAYSTAIDMDETMVACYANRSICYFASSMFMDCVEDCEDAIKLLTSAEITNGNNDQTTTSNSTGVVVNIESVTDNQMVVKLSMRKAAARCHLGQYAESLAAYENALTYQDAVLLHYKEKNMSDAVATAQVLKQNIEGDITKLKLLNEAESLKLKGDAHISNGEVPEAIAMYDAALELIPIFVSCLSNRSACKLSQGDIQGCIDDCTAAITLLQSDTSKSNPGAGGIVLGSAKQHPQSSMLSAILPPQGSEKRTQWLLKTVVRRGAAYFQAHNVDAAITDYGLAVSLDQKNEALKKDLNKMMNTRAAMVQAPESIGLPAKDVAASSSQSPMPPAPPTSQ